MKTPRNKVASLDFIDHNQDLWGWRVFQKGEVFFFYEYKNQNLVCEKEGDFLFMMVEFISAASLATGNLVDYIQDLDGNYILIPQRKS